MEPRDGDVLDKNEVEIKGFAWSGNGRNIVKVDVSLDNGKTWKEAELLEGSCQPKGKAWAWTFWKAKLNIDGNNTKIISKATDSNNNTQQVLSESFWNIRGLNNNCQYKINIRSI